MNMLICMFAFKFQTHCANLLKQYNIPIPLKDWILLEGNIKSKVYGSSLACYNIILKIWSKY